MSSNLHKKVNYFCKNLCCVNFRYTKQSAIIIFCSSEWKQKVNLVDYRENDTVSFNMKNTWMFNKGQSGNLTGDELVTIPHVAVLVSTWDYCDKNRNRTIQLCDVF